MIPLRQRERLPALTVPSESSSSCIDMRPDEVLTSAHPGGQSRPYDVLRPVLCRGYVWQSGPRLGAVRVLSGAWSRREGGLGRAAGRRSVILPRRMASGAGLAHTYVMTVWSMLEECPASSMSHSAATR